MSSIPRTQVKNKQGIAQETIIPALRRQRQVDICVSPSQPPPTSLSHTHTRQRKRQREKETRKKEETEHVSGTDMVWPFHWVTWVLRSM